MSFSADIWFHFYSLMKLNMTEFSSNIVSNVQGHLNGENRSDTIQSSLLVYVAK